MDESIPRKATIVDMLRGIKKDSWAEVEEQSGWTYHTNIGVLAHNAADEIDRLQFACDELSKKKH